MSCHAAASHRLHGRSRQYSPWMATLAFFVMALLVRLAPLNRYVTPDEPIWVQRSVAFADAVAARNWAAIPQTGHPGLTTMMLGALGIRLATWLYPAEAAAHLAWIRNIAWLAPENEAAFGHLAFFLPFARLPVLVVTATGVALAYALGRRRLGARTARWLACFLALDPFCGGLSGLLHTDALQATFILLAVLLVFPRRRTYAKSDIAPHSTCSSGAPMQYPTAATDLTGLRRPVRSIRAVLFSNQNTRSTQKVANFFALFAVKENYAITWYDVVLAALCLALAGMTKTLGLLVAPGVAVTLLLLPRETWTRRVLRVAVLTVLTTVLYLALYPPFWSDPRTALTALIAAVNYHEGIGLRNVFFAGRLTADPGPLFYPAVLCFRLTPPVLIGLALAIYDGIKARRLRQMGISAWGFAIPALVYLAAITLATKKFDRYALTVGVLLSGVAAQTWARRSGRWKWALLAMLLWPWALVTPLPLHYADPLLGGPWLARQIIPLGWGESDGIAAAYLARRLPDPTTSTLLTTDVPGAASYFPGMTWRYKATLLPCADTLITEGTAPAGYTAVETLGIAGLPLTTLYTQTLALPADLSLVLPGPLSGAPADAVAPSADPATLRAWLEERFVPGAPFIWVHAPTCYPLNETQLTALLNDGAGCEAAGEVAGLRLERCLMPATLPETTPFRARFGGALDLIAAAWMPTAQASDALAVRLRWQAQAPLGALNFYLTLRDAADVLYAQGGDMLTDTRAWRTTAWEPGAFVEGTAYIPVDLMLPPGVYTLTLSVSGSAGWVGVTLADGAFGGTRVELGQVEVLAPPYPATELPGVTAFAAPVNAASGLRLLGAGTLPAELWAGERLTVRLAWERQPGAPPDTLRWRLTCADASSEGHGPLAPSAPVTWHAGHRYIARYALRTDPQLPEGPCTLTVEPTSGAPVVLGEVMLRQRPRRFTLPQNPQMALNVTMDDFARLVGVDVGRATLSPGETFTVTLYTQATGTIDRDYTAFVHLIGAEGRVWAQSDHQPEGGAAPTSSWVAGQVIVDTHTLTLAPDAPAGEYTIFAGLYDAERGPRVPLYDANGAPLMEARAPVGTVTVKP